jgi:hypothetical protein
MIHIIQVAIWTDLIDYSTPFTQAWYSMHGLAFFLEALNFCSIMLVNLAHIGIQFKLKLNYCETLYQKCNNSYYILVMIFL